MRLGITLTPRRRGSRLLGSLSGFPQDIYARTPGFSPDSPLGVRDFYT